MKAKKDEEQVVHVNKKPLSIVAADEQFVRVGALSWSQTDPENSQWLPDTDLVRTLDLLRMKQKGAKFRADLILCSAASFFTNSDESFDNIAARIEAAAGCPVAFEWPDGDDRSRWVLVKSGKMWLLRRDQYVTSTKSGTPRANDVYQAGHLVLAELAAGFRVIEVESSGEPNHAALVLLICGEARVLDADGMKSLFKRSRVDAIPIPDAVKKDLGWVLLHPSHRPYANHGHHDGYNLVGDWTLKGPREPVFASLVTHACMAYEDDTCAPRAVVHAGPFQPGDKKDDDVAVVSFWLAKGNKAASSRGARTTLDGVIEVRYAEFDV